MDGWLTEKQISRLIIMIGLTAVIQSAITTFLESLILKWYFWLLRVITRMRHNSLNYQVVKQSEYWKCFLSWNDDIFDVVPWIFSPVYCWRYVLNITSTLSFLCVSSNKPWTHKLSCEFRGDITISNSVWFIHNQTSID